MQKIQTQLKAIAKTLLGLSEKLQKVTEQVGTRRVAKPAAAPKVKPARVKKSSAKAAVVAKESAEDKSTVLGTVFDTIKKSRKGITIAKLKDKTNLGTRQVSNAHYKLTKRGDIEARARGLYFKKK